MTKITFLFALCLLLLISCKKDSSKISAFFRADAAYTGEYKTTGINRLKGQKWKYKTNGRVFSSPVISRDVLYMGSNDSVFYALNSRNGKLLWKYKTGGRISSSAAVYGDKVYFLSFDGILYCLDRKKGKEIWKFKTSGEKVFAAPGIHGMPEKDRMLEDPWDMFLSSPVVANDKVFFGCGDGIFYALNCNTGEKMWSYTTQGLIHTSPAYADSSVYFGSWDSYLYALNSETGQLKWKFQTGTDTVNYNQVGFQSSTVIYNGTVYTGCRDANVWAINAKDGNLKWKYSNNGSWVISTPAIKNDTLYFSTSDTHKIIALNANNGMELFSGDCKSFGFSSPSINNETIYLGNFTGSLLACDARTAKLKWEFRTEASRIDKDTILNKDGNYRFEKIFKSNTYDDNIKAMDVLYSVGSILSSPAVDKEMVYFGSADGCIYALY